MHKKIKKRSLGQSLIEYVALTALVAIVCISTVKIFGGKIRTRLNQITRTFDRNIQQGLRTRGANLESEEQSTSLLPKGLAKFSWAKSLFNQATPESPEDDD